MDIYLKVKMKMGIWIKVRLISFFLKFLSLAGIPHPQGGPRVHSFRHTFCVHRLKIWVLDKKDITALFPYLCAYIRLTADLYPDIIHKTEIYFYGGDQDVK